MEMIENQEKETENEKEQENGTSDRANGGEPERSDQEDEESGEVVACEYSCHSTSHHFGCFAWEASAIQTQKFHTDDVDLSGILWTSTDWSI